MRGMFDGCKVLQDLDLSSFDTSNVTDMGYMFNYCLVLSDLDISSFDTSNVIIMDSMFKECYALANLDLSSFDTRQVTDMREMFRYDSNLKTIYATEGKWSTSLAASTNHKLGSTTYIGTSYMFYNCGTSEVTYK